jgi:hypothetical protein
LIPFITSLVKKKSCYSLQLKQQAIMTSKKRAYNPFPLTCVKEANGPNHLRDNKRDQLMFGGAIEGTQSSSHLDDIDVRSTDFT